MTDLWVTVWTVLFFGGLGVFTVLSVMTIIFGGHDLVMLLTALRRRHAAQQADDAPPEASS